MGITLEREGQGSKSLPDNKPAISRSPLYHLTVLSSLACSVSLILLILYSLSCCVSVSARTEGFLIFVTARPAQHYFFLAKKHRVDTNSLGLWDRSIERS